MTRPSLEETLNELHRLPSLPAVVSELVVTVSDAESSVEQLAQGIAKDQSLAAQALRVANSPFYGIQHRVAGIHDAIVILGFRAVGSMVTAAAVTQLFPVVDDAVFDHAAFWRHGIGTALCARALASHTGLDAEAAFTAGLLHDIGVLALLTLRTQDYREVLEQCRQHDCGLAEVERERLGFDHAQVGGALALRWRLPQEIADAVCGHHAPADVAHATLADVVHVANTLAHALDLSGRADERVPPLDAGAWQRLGLDAARIKAMLGQIEQEHASYCALLTRK